MAEVVDKRRNMRLLEELGDWTPNADKNPNRLSNLRWPVGQEPDGEGSVEGDGWVNVKLDVTEHDDGPYQRHLLTGGPKTILPCHVCGQETRIGGSKNARTVLEEFGYVNIPTFKSEDIVIVVCPAGHYQQVTERMARDIVE